MNEVKSFNLTEREAKKLQVAAEIARKLMYKIDTPKFALKSSGAIMDVNDLWTAFFTLGEIGDAQNDGKVEYTVRG